MENSKLSDVKGKELVAAGHAFAKAIGMDTPLIEIAKMVSVLATRLDCALVRGDTLAAENAAQSSSLKALATLNNRLWQWTSRMSYNASYVGEPEGMVKGHIREMEKILDPTGKDTPATDAYLNAVRAEGAEAFAHHQRVIADSLSGDEQRSHRITACRAEDFANQLRAGEPS